MITLSLSALLIFIVVCLAVARDRLVVLVAMLSVTAGVLLANSAFGHFVGDASSALVGIFV